MSDAADVMRDLLRKGLQVNIVIVLIFQISIVIDMVIINMVININNNMIIMIKTSGGFVCTTSRVASNRGGDFSFRYKFTWKGTSSMILIMISEFCHYFVNSPQPEVWAYFTNSVRDPVAFVNSKVYYYHNPTSDDDQVLSYCYPTSNDDQVLSYIIPHPMMITISSKTAASLEFLSSQCSALVTSTGIQSSSS